MSRAQDRAGARCHIVRVGRIVGGILLGYKKAQGRWASWRRPVDGLRRVRESGVQLPATATLELGMARLALSPVGSNVADPAERRLSALDCVITGGLLVELPAVGASTRACRSSTRVSLR